MEWNPAEYFNLAYFGDGWISIRLDLGDNDWDALAGWLQKSWSAVAPARLRQAHAISDEF